LAEKGRIDQEDNKEVGGKKQKNMRSGTAFRPESSSAVAINRPQIRPTGNCLSLSIVRSLVRVISS